MSERHIPTVMGWLLALLVAAGFVVLGLWQLGRAEQKRQLLMQAQQTLLFRHALPFAAAAQVARANGFDWASGDGEFVQGPAVLLDNRVRNGQVGVVVYRPFVPSAGGPPLLVELGWQPLPGDRVLPLLTQMPGKRKISGLLAPPPSPGLMGATAAVQANGDVLVVVLKPTQLAAQVGLKQLAPRVLKLDPTLPIGYQRDLDVLPNTLPPERHLGYAVQWFGLAFAVLATAGLLTWRRRGAAREKMGHDPL